MKLLLDMNMPISLCAMLDRAGHESAHWRDCGSPSAGDRELLHYALEKNRIVLTHDLDFGAILAIEGMNCPSVVQVRRQGMKADKICPLLLEALSRFESELTSGALVVVDEIRSRVRILPINRKTGENRT